MEGEFSLMLPPGGAGFPSAPTPGVNRVGEKDWERSLVELLLHRVGPGSDNMAGLLAGAPRSVGFEPVRDTLLSVPGVRATHELHLWALTLTYHVASAHLAIGESVLTQPAPPQNQPLCFHVWTAWGAEVLFV